MTVTVLLVEKKGTVKEVELKTYNEEELYKKAGLKTPEGFEFQTDWGAEIDGNTYSVSLFGKTDGRAGQENKYEFPPPVDNVLFFGTCILVNKKDGVIDNITKEEWLKVYDHLYGGFDDIGDDDSELSEDDMGDNVPRTKEGYVKDDFVVDDDEADDDDYEESEEENDESSEEEVKKKKSKPAKKAPAKKTAKAKAPKNVFQIVTQTDNYLDCTDELSEEEYVS
jgi:hypothetical protein